MLNMASRAPGLRGRVSSRYRQLSCTSEHKNRQLCTKRRKTSLFRVGGELLVHASLYVMNSVAPWLHACSNCTYDGFHRAPYKLGPCFGLGLRSDCDALWRRVRHKPKSRTTTELKGGRRGPGPPFIIVRSSGSAEIDPITETCVVI